MSQLLASGGQSSGASASTSVLELHIRIVVLEKTLESPLDCKEIKPVSPKGNQPLIFIGRTVAEAEAVILWIPAGKK